MDCLMSNAAFLTSIYLKDSADTGCIMQLLSSMDDNEDAWSSIGFKYIAPIMNAVDRPGFYQDHPWLRRILQAVEDPQNGVADSVHAGIDLWKERVASLKHQPDQSALSDAVIDYLENRLSAFDRDLLQSLQLPDESGTYYPINQKGYWSFGVVNPWPGDMSAEAEVLSRMKAGADDAGIQMTMLSNFCHVLDPKTQKQTEEYARPDELDFVISTHYDTHKSLDAFYYHTLWNPPEIPLNLDDYTGHVTDDYVMNDDYLIYDDGGMSGHLECILANSPRKLDGASSLTASFPGKCVLKPKLDDPKMFYCGMNWERVVHHTNRHEGLFKLLDATGKVKFFGPDVVKAWGGLRPWEGYKCYQYSIPFDGFSILKEINDCGICLVLSSDIHRRAGSATNRTYEACAAGAVIISDDNPFMLKYFSDAALFIQYNKNDPQDTFRQLMEKYQWIIEHREEALELANRAQQIFLERFAVDLQLKNIVQNHPQRLQHVKDALFAKNEDGVVLAGFVLNTQKESEIERLLFPILQNVERQYYRNIQLVIAADVSISEFVEMYCRKRLYSAKVFPMQLYDFKGSRKLTDAEALNMLYQAIPHDYFINLRSEENWFRDHITTLVRTIEDSGACFAYSGRLFEDSTGYRRTDMFRNLQLSTIYLMVCPDWMPVPGQILFSSKCHSFLPQCMMPFLDGYEHYALMNAALLREKCTGRFSRRMSFSYKDGKWDERCTVLEAEKQIRLIRDYVKYDMPSGGIGGESAKGIVSEANTSNVMRILAYVPVKLWLSVRFQRIVLRIVPSRSKLHASVEKRYQKKLDELIRYGV